MEKKKTKKEIVKMLLNNNELGEKDEEELLDLLIDQPLSIDVEKKEDANMTYGDKMADKVSEAVGSWKFIIGFTLFLVIWIFTNGYVLVTNAFDPYPFILLNLFLSCVAAIQAPIIMMSQNRQAKKDSLRNENDYRTDLKSELILENLHDDIDEIKKNQRKILRLLGEEDEKK